MIAPQCVDRDRRIEIVLVFVRLEILGKHHVIAAPLESGGEARPKAFAAAIDETVRV